MQNAIANWLNPAPNQQLLLAQQQLHQLRTEVQHCQQQLGKQTQMLHAIAERLEEGLAHRDPTRALLYTLPDGRVVMLLMHHVINRFPFVEGWDFYLYAVEDARRECIGNLSATVGPEKGVCISAADSEDICWLMLNGLTVNERYRGQGVGSWMLDTIEEIARTITPVDYLKGEIAKVDWERADKLKRLYTRQGYTVVLFPNAYYGTLSKVLAKTLATSTTSASLSRSAGSY